MSNASVAAWGPDAEPPATNAHINLQGIDVFVDLTGLIDVAAEVERLEKEGTKLQNLIQSKAKKLDNANFVDRAPADVVAKERESLAQLEEQLKTVQASLEELRRRS
jgi:valyl-tRNA synthetase